MAGRSNDTTSFKLWYSFLVLPVSLEKRENFTDYMAKTIPPKGGSADLLQCKIH